MPRERGMPGMYANAVPLGAYGSPYSRPLLSGQQQIPKLLSSKWVLLYIFPSLKNIAVWFWSVALLQISGFRNSSSSCRRYILTALMFFCRWTFRQYFFIHFFFKNFKWLYSDIWSDLVSLHGEVLNFEHFSHQWIGNVLYCFIWCLLWRLILPKSKYHFLPHPWPHKQITYAFRRGKPLLSYEKTMLRSL